ncbi:2-isopropylmalate synthase [Pseudosulfitobacter sp. DSM 107133]|uniref:2-isopropylmalate synthase n=1 Tax=Pseudosulfitobacter sp. DSM 107133 TaxID=2883100 RepID=UPI000DF4A993|nr:2-isopropylmalate synthase [Pseudosulfitobacter sp. DSM 107133]UOA25743.1 hypothetical protein DSM107133_00427 [Pseudosulfitobacter sp. DSM 107133]
MFRTAIIATAICATASVAAAGELTYGNAFIKQHRLDADGAGAADLTVLGVGIEYTANAWTFSGEAAHFDLEGTDLDYGSLAAEYRLNNGVSLGLDYSSLDLAGSDTSLTSVFAYYDMGTYALGAAIGESSDLNDTVYTLFGSWDVAPTGTVGLDIIRIEGETLFAGFADYDMDIYNVQADVISTDGLDLVSVAGGYSFGNGFSAIGSVSYFDLAGTDGTSVTVGGQYEFVEGANVELALGRINIDGAPNIDQVSFGVNYELGRRTSSRRTLGNVISSATGSVAGLTSF